MNAVSINTLLDTRIALREVRDFIKGYPGFEEVRFVLFSTKVLNEFESAWAEIGSQNSE